MLAGAASQTQASLVKLNADFYHDVKAYGNVVVDLRPDLNRTIYSSDGERYTYFDYNYTAASDEGVANLAERNFRLTANHPAVGYVPADTGLPGYPTTDQEGNARQYPLSAGAYTLTGSTEPTPNPGNATIRARGTTGLEQIVLRFNDQPVGGPIILDTSYQEYPITLDRVDGNFKVAFINDDGGRDVYVDWLEVGSVRRQAELQDINTGAWVNEVCGGGTRTEVLHCNGYIDFGALDSEVAAGEVTVGVVGKCGGEDMHLKVDGTTVATWYDVGTDLTTRTYPDYTGGSIQVEFFDNGTDEAGCNRNLLVDYVVIEGTRYETEEVATAYPEYANCNAPDVMQCNGYFDFGDLSTSGVAAQATADRKLAAPKQATSRFQAYPNPASDQLTVQGSEDYQVRAYDLNGRPVLQYDHLQDRTTVDLSQLQPGVYLIKAQDARGELVQQRIVVQ